MRAIKRSAYLLVVTAQGKVLLLQRSSQAAHFPGQWEFPGGKVDAAAGESPYQGMVREVAEETALAVGLPTCEPVWRTVGPPGEVEYSFFAWKPTGPEQGVTLSDHHQAFAWVSFTEARRRPMRHEHRAFLDRYWHHWHLQQIEAYRQEFPSYTEYARFLAAILDRLKARWSPLAIVQARAKTLSSFAEKCVRKADKYDDPVHQLTDLCGARLITPTTQEVDTLIRQLQKLFAVVEFQDKRTQHDTDKFGYLSKHLIVQVPEGVPQILGVPVPKVVGARKAEIQVRTMLQHAHSDIGHDRLYRSAFTVPEESLREAARVAALLEVADDRFTAVVRQIDTYLGHYAAHLEPEKRRREMDDLKLVLLHEPEEEKKPLLALRIARLARAAWDWPSLLECVEPYLGTTTAASDSLRMEAGHALCQLHQRSTTQAKFRRGLKLLNEVARPGEPADLSLEWEDRDRRATALAWLAWAHLLVEGQRDEAQTCLTRAVELAPDDPYHLVARVELDVITRGADDCLSAFTSALRQAAVRCEDHIRAGIEVTRAWFALAKLRFLLKDPYSAFEALCLGARSAETHYPLAEAVRSFQRLKDAIGRRQPEVKWLCQGAQLLVKAKALSAASDKARFDWQPLICKFQFDASLPVTILAGSTSKNDDARITACEPLLLEGLADHKDTSESSKGLLISGGTTAGVCKMAARLKHQVNASGHALLQLIGYRPDPPPPGTRAQPGYDQIVATAGADNFSPLEPIQMWTDLLMSGVDPGKVTLFCLGGSELAAAELALAWALGARTGVVNDGTRAAQRFAALLDWAGGQTQPGMLLPDDRRTVTAFFAFDAPIDPGQWDRSGDAVHRAYVQSQQERAQQPNLLPWPLLREDFKDSNRHQAACAVEILRRCGFVVAPVQLPPDQIPRVQFTPEQVEQLAEWEHGRWNVERLKAGWRYGEKRDDTRKLHPNLVPWRDLHLPETVKNNDRNAVRQWPAILADAGWQIRPREDHGS